MSSSMAAISSGVLASFGDLATTNQAGLTAAFGSASNIAGTNNYGLLGIAPTSPAAIKNAGMNQIADTASVTLLTGHAW